MQNFKRLLLCFKYIFYYFQIYVEPWIKDQVYFVKTVIILIN